MSLKEKTVKLKIKRSLVVRWIVIAAALLLAGGGTLAARLSVDFADWYAFNVYPIIVNIFARISGFFPFSLAETVVVLAVLLSVTAIVYFIVQTVRRKGERLSFIVYSVSTAGAVVSCVAMMFVYACGINYSRSPFSAYSGIKVEKYTKEQLYDTLVFMIDRTNGLISQTELDEEGNCVLPDDLYPQSDQAMRNIAERYPSLNSFYPAPKPVMLSPLWCYTEIVGTFTFFTMEANYNTCERAESIGYTICHELSHMTGFMREDEAGFISYLACRESGSAYLEYSGCHCAMKRLLNAYAGEAKGSEYAEVYSRIDPAVQKQIAMYNDFWDQYETPVAAVSTAINDTYLKINDQSDGTKSYGRMVDLVIAEYLQNFC